MGKAERRLFPRKDFNAGVYCYVDGRRYDARASNISGGGMFLATEEEVPIGHTLAMVFKSKSGKKVAEDGSVKYGAGIKGEPVFLIGRVMRKQGHPIKGVGLRWVRAVTDAAPEDLDTFLNKLLRIKIEGSKRVRLGPNKELKTVFEFENLFQDMIKFGPVTGEEREPMGLESLGGSPASSARELYFDDDVERQSDGPLLPREASKHGAVHRTSGPLTNRIRKNERLVPTSANGVLTVGTLPVPVHVSAIGLQGLFAESPVVPTDRSEPVSLTIEVATRRQVEKVRCMARVVGVDDGAASGSPGIYLEFLEFPNPEEKKTMEQFVRWIHFRALST